MLVLVSHIFEVFGLKRIPAMHLWGINYIGSLGVFMFFIHTSLVLMMSLERIGQTGNRPTIRFYVRRAFRIYPLSITVVVLVELLRIPSYFEPNFQWPGSRLFIANLLLIQNVFRSGIFSSGARTSVSGPLWSLPFEVQMYLLLPFLYIVAKRIRSARGTMALLCAGFALMYGAALITRTVGIPDLGTYAPWFFMGVSAFTVYKRCKPTLGARWYPIALLLFVALPCLGFRLIQDYRSGWLNWYLGAAFALLLPRFHEIHSPLVRRVSHALATYSYGIYLTHVPILWFAFQKLHNKSFPIQVGICLLLLVTVPVVLYHGLEAPLLNFGAKLANRLASETRSQLVAANGVRNGG